MQVGGGHPAAALGPTYPPTAKAASPLLPPLRVTQPAAPLQPHSQPWRFRPSLPRHPQALSSKLHLLSRVLGPERGRGSQGTEQGAVKLDVSKAPGSPCLNEAPGQQAHGQPTPRDRGGWAASELPWAWGAWPVGTPGLQRWVPFHAYRHTLIRKHLNESSGLRAAKNFPGPPHVGCTCSWHASQCRDFALLCGPQALWALGHCPITGPGGLGLQVPGAQRQRRLSRIPLPWQGHPRRRLGGAAFSHTPPL